jgi:hypothetical protein
MSMWVASPQMSISLFFSASVKSRTYYLLFFASLAFLNHWLNSSSV